MKARTAVILDPQPMWLEAVASILERVGVRVVGKTTDRATAVALVSEHRPELLIAGTADEETTLMVGFDYLSATLEQVPGMKCIVLSTEDDQKTIDAAFAAGAVAYVLKSARPDDLASAVSQSFEQSIYYPGPVLAGPMPAGGSPAVAVAELTNREREILRLMAEGHSNVQLAKMLWVTEQTVKFHLSNVYRKINVSNRTEAARWAQLNGLLPANDDLPISA